MFFLSEVVLCITVAFWYERRFIKKSEKALETTIKWTDIQQKRLGACQDKDCPEYRKLLEEEIDIYYEWLNAHPYCGGWDYFYNLLSELGETEKRRL